jgi:hypothetical protein
MDVVQIHSMLRQVWPNGIPEDAYPLLAGIMTVNRTQAASLFALPLVQGLMRGLTTTKKPYSSKLTMEQATKIRAALDRGERGVDLACQYGVSEPTISHIRHNRAWRNPTPKAKLALSRHAPERMVWAVKALLDTPAGLPRSRTQKEIAKLLKLGPWTVKRTLWQLVREGKVQRIKSVQGPHRYKATWSMARMKTEVEVFLVARTTIRVMVEHDEDESATDLTEREKWAAIDKAPAFATWEVDDVKLLDGRRG